MILGRLLDANSYRILKSSRQRWCLQTPMISYSAPVVKFSPSTRVNQITMLATSKVKLCRGRLPNIWPGTESDALAAPRTSVCPAKKSPITSAWVVQRLKIFVSPWSAVSAGNPSLRHQLAMSKPFKMSADNPNASRRWTGVATRSILVATNA